MSEDYILELANSSEIHKNSLTIKNKIELIAERLKELPYNDEETVKSKMVEYMCYDTYHKTWTVLKQSGNIKRTFPNKLDAEEYVFKNIICSNNTSRGFLCCEYVPRQCLRDKRLPNISRLVATNALTEDEKKYLNITVYELDRNIKVYEKWGYNPDVKNSEDNYELFKKMPITDPNIVKNFNLLQNMATLLNINIENMLREKEMTDYSILGIAEIQDTTNDVIQLPQDTINDVTHCDINSEDCDSEDYDSEGCDGNLNDVVGNDVMSLDHNNDVMSLDHNNDVMNTVAMLDHNNHDVRNTAAMSLDHNVMNLDHKASIISEVSFKRPFGESDFHNHDVEDNNDEDSDDNGSNDEDNDNSNTVFPLKSFAEHICDKEERKRKAVDRVEKSDRRKSQKSEPIEKEVCIRDLSSNDTNTRSDSNIATNTSETAVTNTSADIADKEVRFQESLAKTKQFHSSMKVVRSEDEEKSDFLEVLSALFKNFSETHWMKDHVRYIKDERRKHSFHILIPSGCHAVWAKIYNLCRRGQINLSRIFVDSLYPYTETLIKSATTSIDIAMYKLNDASIIDVLKDKWQTSRKLEIRILLNYSTNKDSKTFDMLFDFLAYCASMCLENDDSKIPEILFTNTDESIIFHSKVYIADKGVRCISGSANGSPSGNTKNFEIISVSTDNSFNSYFQNYFDGIYEIYSTDIHNNLWAMSLKLLNNFSKLKAVVKTVTKLYPSLGELIFEKLLSQVMISQSIDDLFIGNTLSQNYDLYLRYIREYTNNNGIGSGSDSNYSSDTEGNVHTNLRVTRCSELKSELYEVYKMHYGIVDVAVSVVSVTEHDIKHRNLILSMKKAQSSGIFLLKDDLGTIFQKLDKAQRSILIFTITVGLNFIDKLIQIKTTNKNIAIVLVFWKLPENQKKVDALVRSGIGLIQIDTGCQHIKTIIVDDQIITNCGSANLSESAYEGKRSSGEFNTSINHSHKTFEANTMKLLSLLGIHDACGLL